ncbi:MAG: hypothetical protein V4718_17295, partial [Pseudomonadota bacterium]
MAMKFCIAEKNSGLINDTTHPASMPVFTSCVFPEVFQENRPEVHDAFNGQTTLRLSKALRATGLPKVLLHGKPVDNSRQCKPEIPNSPMNNTETPPALKEIFNAQRFHHVAKEAAGVYPRFDSAMFLKLALHGLQELSLMQRLRRMTESLHTVLPADFERSVVILKKLAPRINSGFVTLVLPDYVALYGRDHFDASMEALKFFTVFGSSEFAVREFIRADPVRALKVMKTWARDDSEHVRRLASEGS